MSEDGLRTFADDFSKGLFDMSIGAILGFLLVAGLSYLVIAKLVIPQMKKDGDFPPKL